MKETQNIESPLSLLDQAQNSMFGPHNNPDEGVTKVDEQDDDSVADLNPKPKDHDEEEIPDDVKGKLDGKPDEDVEDDDDDVEPEDKKKKSTSTKDDEEDEEVEDDDESEDDSDDEIDPAELEEVSSFFDVFAEALGVDVDEDNKPDTIDGLTKWVHDLIDENSTPQYSSEEVKNLDDYIKAGGKFEDYYNKAQQEVDYNNINLEDEENQKSVVRDYLKKTGYSDSQISKKLERFEEAGLLEDEANDSLDRLKDITKHEKETTLKAQEEAKNQQVKQQQEFYQGITNDIDHLTTVRNVKIPKEDRPKLKEYLFKADSTGTTQYAKDWSKDIKKNLIESAYFMMKGDSLLKSASRSGETSAVKKLRQSFKTSKGNKSQDAVSDKQPTPILEAASALFGRSK